MLQEPPFVVAIVDDDAGFRDAIGWLLKANGYGVRGYGDAPSFLDGHDPTFIGCVLLDLRLDDSCGIDALVEARQRGLETVRVEVAIGTGGASIVLPVLLHVAQRNRLTPGTEVTLTLRPEGIHLLKGE